LKTWTITVQEDPDDPEGAVLQFPDDMMESLRWKEGDTLNWDDQGDGTAILTKVTP